MYRLSYSRFSRPGLKRQWAIIALAVLLFRCATFNHGPVQRIHVDSNPAGAAVHAEGCGIPWRASRLTPAVVWVSRMAKRCTLTVSLAGHGQQTFFLRREISDAIGGNVEAGLDLCNDELTNCNSADDLLGPVLLVGTGMLVDRLTGGMFEQTPARIMADFLAYTDEPSEEDSDPEP